jgi:hypothetical protein
MSAGTALRLNRGLLVPSFRAAIVYGLLSAWRRCDDIGRTPETRKPQEPDLVAGLVLDSTPLIYSALTAALSPIGVSVHVAGVFCHQSPIVKPEGFGTGCELGDLLVAYVHSPRHAPVMANAILLQAKVTSDQPYEVDRDGQVQLALYSKWPDFSYTRPPRLARQKRSVTPKSPHAGAQYLIIDGRPPEDPQSGLLGFPGTYPAACCMPDDLLFDYCSLEEQLFGLLTFSTGRPFEPRQTAMNGADWSQVVWDLLSSTFEHTFRRKRSGRIRAPRASAPTVDSLDGFSFVRGSSGAPSRTVSEMAGSAAAQFLFSDGDSIPPNFSDSDDGGEGSGGVSVVLIETAEAEARADL